MFLIYLGVGVIYQTYKLGSIKVGDICIRRGCAFLSFVSFHLKNKGIPWCKIYYYGYIFKASVFLFWAFTQPTDHVSIEIWVWCLLSLWELVQLNRVTLSGDADTGKNCFWVRSSLDCRLNTPTVISIHMYMCTRCFLVCTFEGEPVCISAATITIEPG